MAACTSAGAVGGVLLRMTPLKRSALAIALCCGLLLVLVDMRNNVREAESEVAASITSTVWQVSELIYEAQSLITAFVELDAGTADIDDVRLQFDLLWSRVTVAELIDFKERPRSQAAIRGFRAWLDRYDPVLFQEDTLTHGQIQHMHRSLDPLVVAIRKGWVTEFNASHFGGLGQIGQDTQAKREQQEIAIFALLTLIIAYLGTEIYFGGKAQARERALRAQADAGNRTKSDFIASMSHEIRTPLNGIVSMAAHLADHPLNKEQRQCLSVIESSGGLLLDTINDVLDLSRVKSGELPINNAVFDPFKSLRMTYDVHRSQAIDKGLTLDLILPDGPLPKVEGDERRFRQILNNLVSNAIKFTSAGHVRITARFGTADPDLEAVDAVDAVGRGLYISVSDTGCGIPYDARQLVFEPFEQISDTMTRHAGGTGLGLPLTRSLCQAMGGTITLESDLGLGACFEVFLPFPRMELMRPAYIGRSDARTEDLVLKGRVMIVDDTLTNRFVLRKLLSKHALEIFEAESGFDALEQLATLDVDVVLMDIQMPGMTGVEATMHLHEAAALTQRIPPPVIAVTANIMPEQIQSYKAVGMVEVLSKPVLKQALLTALGTILLPAQQDVTSDLPDSDQRPRSAG